MAAILYRVCAGIDVHAKVLVVALRIDQPDESPQRLPPRKFGTNHADLVQLRRWLLDNGCEAVGMESTGVYWKPLYRVLEGSGMKVFVGNAQHLKHVPGRSKTDKEDAQWLAHLVATGFIKPSFVPTVEHEELREDMRLRTRFVQLRSNVRNRITRLLERAGVKLKAVISGFETVTARRILEALATGETDPERLARHRQRRCVHTKEEFVAALSVEVPDSTRRRLRLLLCDEAHLNARIAELDEQLDVAFAAMNDAVQRLMTIPGFGQTMARIVLSEIGTDMSRFGSAQRLACWSGLSPGNHQSAGKRRAVGTAKGNRHLRRALVEGAWSLKTSSGWLPDKFRALQARIGGKKAAVAVAHKLIVVAWHVLNDGVNYDETRYAQRNTQELERRLRRLAMQLRAHGWTAEPPAVA